MNNHIYNKCILIIARARGKCSYVTFTAAAIFPPFLNVGVIPGQASVKQE